jgi:endonuclease/exonuclease/phosphatase family metal-dependent hydrolase
VHARSRAQDVVLIGGDFNDWRRRVGLSIKSRLNVQDAADHISAQRRATYPSLLPCLELDRIYYRGAQLLDARILRGPMWRNLSDHAPVTADFLLDPR